MKKLMFSVLMVMMIGCSTTPTNPVLTPIQAVGCDVETAVTTAFAATVATSLACTNQTAIQSSFQTALGNVNFCASSSVSSVTAAQIKDAAAKMTSKVAKPMGIVGTIVCPIAINTIIGYATAQIPTTWGCSASVSASTVGAALTAACEAAVPL